MFFSRHSRRQQQQVTVVMQPQPQQSTVGGAGRRRPQQTHEAPDNGCCSMGFLKAFLYVFNMLFWVSGLVLVGVAIWSRVFKHEFASLLDSATYVAATYLLLLIGLSIIVIGILGCCAIWHESRLCLVLYIGLLVIVFLLEVITGVVAYAYHAAVYDELTHSLNATMMRYYKKRGYEDVTKATDTLHRMFHCCGSSSYSDWQFSRWLRDDNVTLNRVPDSCCKSLTVGCGHSDHPSNIYYKGCVETLASYIQDHLAILGAIALNLCCLQVIGIIFSWCVVEKLRHHAKWARLQQQKQRPNSGTYRHGNNWM